MSALVPKILAFIRGEPAVVVAVAPYLLIGGMAGMALSSFADAHGLLTAFFVFSFGAASAALSDWRSERGLWMLAVLIFLMYGFGYLCFCLGQLRDALRGAQPDSVGLIVDAAIATLLLVAILRFLLRAATENFALFRAPEE